MRARVTERGLLVPKELLAGFDEVEIRQEPHRITILPAGGDPVRNLGRTPLDAPETDASERHDDYLYRP
ncbi:MAG: hypothetical protein IPK64_21560 [bacterium]|nr:hypothetical protein [bacterium]